MAPRLHIALLGTAMASSLLLSPLAAQALPIADATIATTASGQPATTSGAATDGAKTAEEVPDDWEDSTDPFVAEDVIVAADIGGTEVGPSPSDVDVPKESPEPTDSSATETQVLDAADLDPSTSAEIGEAALSGNTVVAADPGSTDTAPTGSDSLVDTGNQVVDRAAVPRGTSASGETDGTKANETVEETVAHLVTEGSTEAPEMPEWVPAITMPEGSEVWDENEWNEFLDSDNGKIFIDDYNSTMMDSPELQAIVDILTDFADTGDDSYLDQLWDYVNELFPDNPEWAQEVFDGIMNGMDDWEFTETDSPKPITPTEDLQKQEPETKPAATVTKPAATVTKPAATVIKPVTRQEPIAQAVAKPIIESHKHELANTGSNGTLIVGGVGVVLLLGGSLALRMRRRQKAL